MATGRQPEPLRRGRPRDSQVEAAILDATIAVLAERGVRDASVEEIAMRAHAGKDTIYRRWRHKADLVHAALDRFGETELPAVTTGVLEDDLRCYLNGVARLLRETAFGEVVVWLVAEARREPALMDRMRRIWSRQAAAIDGIVTGARENAGESPPPLADGEIRIDLLLGPIYARWLLSADAVDEAYVALLVKSVLRQDARRRRRGSGSVHE